jgi:hypothetical protein
MGDYIWDTSADADPEVEEFEEALSVLRYRAGTPELPERLENALRVRRPKRLPWLLAAAAALAFTLLSSHLWLIWRPVQRRESTAQQSSGINENSSQVGTHPADEKAVPRVNDDAPASKETAQIGKPRRAVLSNGPARKRGDTGTGGNKAGRRTAAGPSSAGAARRELYTPDAASGEAARAQIMLALQITSSKLGLAQRMAQKNVVP